MAILVKQKKAVSTRDDLSFCLNGYTKSNYLSKLGNCKTVTIVNYLQYTIRIV